MKPRQGTGSPSARGKMVAPSGSESVWSAWALAFVQDALSHEALHKEAVELILDPAFPPNPFDPGP